MEDAGGVAVPGNFAEFVVGELADPDIAAPGGEGDATVLEEVDTADANPGAERVFGGDGDGVDDVGGGEELSELILEGLFLGRVLFAFDARLERVDLLGLIGLAEHAFSHDVLGPVGGAALSESTEVSRGGDLGGHFAEYIAGIDSAVGERDLKGSACGDLGELERQEVPLVAQD